LEPGFDPYRELGLSPEAEAEPELVRAAFKALAKKYHPDSYPDPDSKARAEEKMRRLNEAQSLILSGKYRPPAPKETGSSLVPEGPTPQAERPARPSEPLARGATASMASSGGASTRARKNSPRKLSPGSVALAVLLLLASFALPSLLRRDRMAEAHRLAEAGQTQAALDQVNRVIFEDPRAGQAYLLRARLWLQLDQPERARVDLANARGFLSSGEYQQASLELFPTPTPTVTSSPTPNTWKAGP
jgi:type II secretory pathway pseudopilin PulG